AEHLIQVDTHLQAPFALLVICRDELSLNFTAETFKRRRSEHSLRCATNTEQNIHTCIIKRRVYRCSHIPIRNKLNPRTGLANFFHQIVMARAIEHDGYEV